MVKLEVENIGQSLKQNKKENNRSLCLLWNKWKLYESTEVLQIFEIYMVLYSEKKRTKEQD